MNKEDIQFLYRYNQWSTAKIMDVADHVTPGQFTAPKPFPYNDLRGTLVHTLFAEWIWRNRWQGISPAFRLKPEDFPTVEALRIRWGEEEALLLAFVDSLTDEQLAGRFSYKATDGTPHERVLWHAMAHLVNHGTQHKTEAAAMLTGFGHSPGDIDMIKYALEIGA